MTPNARMLFKRRIDELNVVFTESSSLLKVLDSLDQGAIVGFYIPPAWKAEPFAHRFAFYTFSADTPASYAIKALLDSFQPPGPDNALDQPDLAP